MSNKDIVKIELTAEMLSNLLTLLSELPTKTNVWPLIQNLAEQARQQQGDTAVQDAQMVRRDPPAN